MNVSASMIILTMMKPHPDFSFTKHGRIIKNTIFLKVYSELIKIHYDTLGDLSITKGLKLMLCLRLEANYLFSSFELPRNDFSSYYF